eukprot:TRINITY_DN8106_c0_g1_i3.p1 TRINITY_DN8106_c0_g1~~TRINITY_DN8106_c0_g1_i3.p1  ORF type:complete len:418 (+),score=51.86 TRINITY_DN8106_c0_g1_i3:78-1331(+)
MTLSDGESTSEDEEKTRKPKTKNAIGAIGSRFFPLFDEEELKCSLLAKDSLKTSREIAASLSPECTSPSQLRSPQTLSPRSPNSRRCGSPPARRQLGSPDVRSPKSRSPRPSGSPDVRSPKSRSPRPSGSPDVRSPKPPGSPQARSPKSHSPRPNGISGLFIQTVDSPPLVLSPMREKSTARRSVTFGGVDEITRAPPELDHQNSNDDLVPSEERMTKEQSPSSGVTCISWICGRQSTAGRRGRETTKKRRASSFEEAGGYAWKLNADVEPTENRMANPRNWRRRFFYLRDHRKKRSLQYISEKKDGSLHNVCTIKAPDVPLAAVAGLPKVQMRLSSPNTQKWVETNLVQYDIAFIGCPRAGAYADAVPDELWPLQIQQYTSEGERLTVTLAVCTEEDRDEWVEQIQGNQGSDGETS